MIKFNIGELVRYEVVHRLRNKRKGIGVITNIKYDGFDDDHDRYYISSAVDNNAHFWHCEMVLLSKVKENISKV